jgi:N6-L-threonylcarbamoyladenine synthase
MQQFKAQFPKAQPVFAIAGGVAANTQIRASLMQTAQDNGFACILPPVNLCTDNAAMIAWAGYEYAPFSKEQDLVARPRWPLDHAVTPLVGYGKKGAKA